MRRTHVAVLAVVLFGACRPGGKGEQPRAAGPRVESFTLSLPRTLSAPGAGPTS